MNLEATRAYHRQWSRDHAADITAKRCTPEGREKQRAASKRYREKNPEADMLRIVKQSARIKGLAFNLTKEDIVIPDMCPVLGIPLFKDGTKGANTPSVDRIKPELGYVKGNILVVSLLANRIKTNATAEQILAVGKFYAELEAQRG